MVKESGRLRRVKVPRKRSDEPLAQRVALNFGKMCYLLDAFGWGLSGLGLRVSQLVARQLGQFLGATSHLVTYCNCLCFSDKFFGVAQIKCRKRLDQGARQMSYIEMSQGQGVPFDELAVRAE